MLLARARAHKTLLEWNVVAPTEQAGKKGIRSANIHWQGRNAVLDPESGSARQPRARACIT